jgi:flagellar biosynthetic protein FliR
VVINLDYQWLVAFLLVLARALGWLMIVPPFSNRTTVPPVATMCVASGLAVLIAPTLPASMIPATTAGFIGSIVIQFITGAAIGFVIMILIMTASTAGSFVDLMGGLNLPPSIDPLSLDQSSMLGQFYLQVAVILLFVSGGYSLLIDGFARSFQAPGFSLASTGRIGEVIVLDFSTMFTSALEIVSPILVVLFATQILLAMLSKAAPQMNVWILGMPIQIFLAIILVAIGISVLPDYVSQLLTRALGDSASLFGAH